LKRLLGPILLLFAIRVFSQTPAPSTHTFSSNLIFDTISSKPATVSASRSAALPASVEIQPLQPFEMRAQLPVNTNEKVVKTVILSTINLQITTTPSTCDGNNGTIVISASGGTAPYQFQLDGGSRYFCTVCIFPQRRWPQRDFEADARRYPGFQIFCSILQVGPTGVL
jgi:hypothetical protein